MGIICVHSMHLLVSNSQELSARTGAAYLSYSDVSYSSFHTSNHGAFRRIARVAEIMTNVLLCITQLGFCCVYFVFISQSFQQVCVLVTSALRTGNPLLRFCNLFSVMSTIVSSWLSPCYQCWSWSVSATSSPCLRCRCLPTFSSSRGSASYSTTY